MAARIHRLPLELFRLIREFLSVTSLLGCPQDGSDLDRFIFQECQQNWRNFLSLSNGEVDRSLRRHLLIWSLNQLESKRYLQEESFRNFLLHRMNDASQLHCKWGLKGRFCWDKLDLRDIPVVLSTIHLNQLIIDGLDVHELPSSESLQSLFVRDCSKLVRMGSYKKLIQLKICHCRYLQAIEYVESLSTFHYECRLECSPEMFHPLEQLFSNFPLSRLTAFFFRGSLEVVKKFVPVLTNLIHLTVLSNTSHSRNSGEFPLLSMPRLECLTVERVNCVNVTGLWMLSTLILREVYIVKGKEEIYPRLKKLKGNLETFLEDDFSNCTKMTSFGCYESNGDIKTTEEIVRKYERMDVLELEISPMNIHNRNSFSPFEISPKVKSLNFNLGPISVAATNPGRAFRNLNFHRCYKLDVFSFQNVESVCIDSCYEITNLQALRNVPYLSLSGCDRIEDFSSLGSQRYLAIQYSKTLKDSDAERFRNVVSLSLQSCANMTKFSSGSMNRIVNIENCKNLREVHLEGNDHRIAKLVMCPNLETLNVSGRVYELAIEFCPKSEKNILVGLENCRYITDNSYKYKKELEIILCRR
jgi:hypothetical protein